MRTISRTQSLLSTEFSNQKKEFWKSKLSNMQQRDSTENENASTKLKAHETGTEDRYSLTSWCFTKSKLVVSWKTSDLKKIVLEGSISPLTYLAATISHVPSRMIAFHSFCPAFSHTNLTWPQRTRSLPNVGF